MLNRNSQVGIKIQAVSGTEESLSDSDFLSNAANHSHTYDPVETDRGLTRGTLSRQAMLKGSRLGEIAFDQELVGGGASTAAPWHTALKGMGFQAVGLKKVTVGAITNGPYVAGQTIGDNAVLGSATKTGIFVRMIGGTTLVYEPVAGTFADTDTVYNYAVSQASSVISGAPAAAGWAFRPQTETDSTPNAIVTAERYLGGERHTIIDARGTGSVVFEVDKAATLKSTFRGPPVFDPSHPNRPRTGSAHAITPVGGTPAPVKGMPLTLGVVGGGSYAPPVLLSVEIDFGLTLSDRKTATDQDIAGSGNLAPRLSDRKVVVKTSPEYVVGSVYDYIANVLGGGSFEFGFALGATTDANGLIQVYAPAAQMNGKVQPGDRDGTTTQDVTLDLCGTSDDEIRIWHVFG